MHDQEPLFFDLYQNLSQEQLSTRWKNYADPASKMVPWVKAINNPNAYDLWYHYIKNLNLKGLTRVESSIADLTMVCHSEINSPELEKYQDAGYVGVYYWSHALICRDWYRFAIADPFLDYRSDNFTKCFNIYSRAWSGSREYRLKFTELIDLHGLVGHSNITFSPCDDSVHYRQHQFKNPSFAPTTTLDHLAENTSSSDSSAFYDTRDYNQHAIDVVLETIFDGPRIHLTEKTIRPIACGKPFILAAGPGAVQVLRNYGFDTFDDLIDTSYDLISDPLERLQSIIREMRRIADLPIDVRRQLWTDLHARAARNKELFWSQRFADRIVSEFDVNYKAAHEICSLPENMTGKYWTEFRKVMSRDTECRKVQVADDSMRTRRDIVNLFLEIKKNQQIT